jgi:DNA-directed RNA polymerase subunit E"
MLILHPEKSKVAATVEISVPHKYALKVT